MKTNGWKTTAAGLALLAAAGCATPQYQANQNLINDAVIGSALGALAGGVIAHNSHGSFERGEGIAAGAILGGLVGSAIGYQGDRFNAQMSAVNELASTTVINVQNSNGSVTPVVLRRVGNQYLGPRGEYYAFVPSAEQLKVAYGF